MTDLLAEARSAIEFGQTWAGDIRAERGSCVEVLERLLVEVERLQAIVGRACKYRNVFRGWRAEDKTKPLPLMCIDEDLEDYLSELRLALFAMLDEYEAAEAAKEKR